MKDDLARLKKLESAPRNDLSFGFRVQRFLVPIATHLKKRLKQQHDCVDIKDTLHNNTYDGVWQFEVNYIPEIASKYFGEIEITVILDPKSRKERIVLLGSFVPEPNGVRKDLVSHSGLQFEIGYSFCPASESDNSDNGAMSVENQFAIKCSGFDSIFSNSLARELAKLELPELAMSENGVDFKWMDNGIRPEACFQMLRFAGRRILQADLLPFEG